MQGASTSAGSCMGGGPHRGRHRQALQLAKRSRCQNTPILMDLIESEFSENSAVLPRTWGTKMPLFSKHFYDNRQIPTS
jgi:hypothetical protein